MSLRIPTPTFSDFSPLGDVGPLMVAARRASDDTRKVSHDIARQDWEDQHKADLERSAMLLPGSPLWTAAQKSTGVANAAGTPYGIHFDETQDKAPLPPVDAEPHPGADAQFLMNGGQHVAPGQSDPLLTSAANPLQGPTPGGAPLSETTAPDATPATPPLDPEAAFAARDAQRPTTRHVYATVQGQRFEAPQDGKADVFPEPQYNAMVDKLIATGKFDDASAIKQVEAVRKADIGEGGKNTRLGAVLGQRENTQLSREEQIKLREQGFDVSRDNSAGRDRAIVTAAGLREPMFTGGGGEGAPLPPLDPKLLSAWLSVHKEGKASGLAKQVVQAKDLFDRARNELDAGQAPNAELQQTAIHTLAAISTSMAGSGRLSVQAMNDIRSSPGIVQNLLNEGNRLLNAGVSPEEYIQPFREAFARLEHVSKLQSLSLYDAVDHQSGTKSVFAQHPGLAGVIAGSMYGFRSDLGLTDEDVGPATDGAAPAPQAGPATASGPARKGAPHKAAAHSDNEAVAWARAHKGDPRAAAILQKNGLSE